LFLQARHLLQQGSAESLQQATAMFEEALAVDPTYAPAWVALSGTFVNLAEAGLQPEAEGYRRAEEAAERAIELNPRSARGYSRLAWIARWRDSDLAAAAHHYEIALTLNPEDVHILAEAAQLLGDLGRIDELIAVYEYVTPRDPMNPRAHYNLGVYYNFGGRYPEAEASFRKALTLSPNFIGTYHHLGLVQLFKGDNDDALASFLKEPDEEWRVKGRALAYHALGREADADAALDELIAGWGEQWPTEVAHVYAYRNEPDKAFEWLANETEESSGWGEGRRNPLFINLHRDPRWPALLERIGKSDKQLAAIKFSLEIPE
jgi:tetratricopeptide (TPR) repeat protein